MPSGVFSLKQQAQARSEGAWPGSPPTTLNYLVVAGGGAGGTERGGGGGAGGLLQGNIAVIPGTSYTVTIGAGGTQTGYNVGGNGSNSVFGSLTAIGGGGGAYSSSTTPSSGGSGGGGGGADSAFSAGAQGTSGQGNRGADGTGGANPNNSGGGGGGAGTAGIKGANDTGGNGGAGIASDISGARVVYAGGGGGGSNPSQGSGGTGGVGGGGNGGAVSTAPGTGGANTGGGGGGDERNNNGGSGGSGIVIVSYPGTTQWFTGGTLSYANGNVIHTFYSSGTLAPTAPSNFVNTDYQITRSLRFNSADSAYLGRTPASATNRKTFTWSGWIKRSKLGLDGPRMFVAGSGSDIFIGRFLTSDAFQIVFFNGTNYGFSTVQVFRDVSSWYHFVIAVDTTQPTAADRFKLYVNGTQVTNTTSLGALVPQNTDLPVNNTVAHSIGIGGGNYFDGYLTEVNFIDGQALTPSAFGYVNPNTGVWSPLKFVGTYGTNGFYLNFSDNSNTTAATLGKDYSGNGNNWTPNNFSVTAGVGNDSLVDTPTSYGTDTGAGGEVRGNYNTLNPLTTTAGTYTQGNLRYEGASGWRRSSGTIPVTTGKWYWEVTLGNSPFAPRSSGTAYNAMGFCLASTFNSTTSLNTQTDALLLADNGYYKNFTNSAVDAAAFSSGDVLAVAVDLDANTFTFYKNNSSIGTGTIGGTAGRELTPCVLSYDGVYGVMDCNFGQRPFAYTAPSGFKALVSQNLPTPTIGATSTTQAGDYFNAVLYTGNGSTQSISGVGFQPDFVWIKERPNVSAHSLYDAVRGNTNVLSSNSTAAEYTQSPTAGLSAFGSDGFTVVYPNTGDYYINRSAQTYVAWNWKANGAGSSNTAGQITSTVSANQTAGFSIVTFTTDGTTKTVGHGLGVKPSVYIVKSRNSAGGWLVITDILGSMQYGAFNSTGLFSSIGYSAPTSTVFQYNDNNGNTQVAYCFAPIAGYSAIGSYTGNGSADGPFVYTGFRPAFILAKEAAGTAGQEWTIYDDVRSTYNAVNNMLSTFAQAETTINTYDFLSNGFKLRSSDARENRNGSTYFYMAFAESPFKYALAR